MLPYRDPSLPLEERLDDLVSRMTLEEKFSCFFIFYFYLSLNFV